MASALAGSASAALITCEDGSDTMSIDLSVHQLSLHKVMSRPTAEGADKTVERMRMLLAPKPAKGSKGVKQTREGILAACPPILFFRRDGAEVRADGGVTNGQFWSQVAAIHIGVPPAAEGGAMGFAVVPVEYNHPMVVSVCAPLALYVGHDASCYDYSCVFCSEAGLDHQWLVGDRVVCERRIFVPAADHVGQTIRYRVRPQVGEGCEAQAWFEVPNIPAVKATPEAPIREGMTKRWALTRTSAFAKYCQQKRERDEEVGGCGVSDALRIVSYNILNDAFATTNWARRVLYPFASEEVRSLGFRQGAILNELRNYNAELMCLQEVGESMYRRYLGPMLTASGFGHFYASKSGMVKDGCAIAYSARRFECVSSFKLPLTLATLRQNHPELSEELRVNHPHLEYDLSKVVSVGAYTVLKDFGGGVGEGPRDGSAKPERYILVGNTHLFYKPHGCHIRAIQALMHATVLHREYRKLVDTLATEGSDLRVHMVCSGDFNFTPITGGYKLLTNGSITDENDCWDKGGKFWWGMEDEGKKSAGGSASVSDGEGQEPVETETNNTLLNKVISTSGVAETTSTPTTDGAVDTNTSTAVAELVQPVGPPPSIFRKTLSLPGLLKFDDTHRDTGTLYTNYSLTFKEVIDHIFVASPPPVSRNASTASEDDKPPAPHEVVVPLGIVPLPSEEDLQADVAIPSSTYPSDHLAIISEVGFRCK
jgi:2',5'-phosphodiesterase